MFIIARCPVASGQMSVASGQMLVASAKGLVTLVMFIVMNSCQLPDAKSKVHTNSLNISVVGVVHSD